MPRKKKHPIEWTSEEAFRELFHPRIIEKAREELEKLEKPRKTRKKASTDSDSTEQ